ncbi:hypothetical protein PPGU19_096480 (plasmid) [Paraburkholderia sp. PGU19]|nr:hypothetical protein PPGU19_096480 [Paraburkholderia sp. PGU19]
MKPIRLALDNGGDIVRQGGGFKQLGVTLHASRGAGLRRFNERRSSFPSHGVHEFSEITFGVRENGCIMHDVNCMHDAMGRGGEAHGFPERQSRRPASVDGNKNGPVHRTHLQCQRP